jgi:hypothetical protein
MLISSTASIAASVVCSWPIAGPDKVTPKADAMHIDMVDFLILSLYVLIDFIVTPGVFIFFIMLIFTY